MAIARRPGRRRPFPSPSLARRARATPATRAGDVAVDAAAGATPPRSPPHSEHLVPAPIPRRRAPAAVYRPSPCGYTNGRPSGIQAATAGYRSLYGAVYCRLAASWLIVSIAVAQNASLTPTIVQLMEHHVSLRFDRGLIERLHR